MDSNCVTISVKNLVEFLLRQGSIDTRGSGSGIDRALEGSRIHRKLQKADAQTYGDAYQSEIPLSILHQEQDLSFLIEGRADGILKKEDIILIDEIKTIETPLEFIDENYSPVHWAQVTCYGYIYAKQNQLESIELQLTYFQVETYEILRFQRRLSFSELERFFLDLVQKYYPWAILQIHWKQSRNQSIQDFPFPYDNYRAGQRKMAAAIFRTIQNEGRLFCQAPTGIGKTMSSLFPAVKSIGLGYGDRIFYLTAKTITRQSAEEAISHMSRKGVQLKSITITAKDKVCFLTERLCNPDDCPYANGYYDRVNSALFQTLQERTSFQRDDIEEIARQHTLCPYEFSLDLSLWCDAIICDYNYLFDPVVYLKRFFEGRGDYIFLIDEAHNLIDRARDMYSAVLKKSDILAVKKEIGKESKLLNSSLNKVNSAMILLRKQCEEEHQLIQKEPFTDIIATLENFSEVCSLWFEENRGKDVPPTLLQLYFDVRFFLRIAELYNDAYVSLVTTAGSEVILRQICLDPAQFLDESLRKGRSTIFFSATLSPIDYFISVLGCAVPVDTGKKRHRKEISVKRCVLPSPFSQEHLGLFVANQISTKFVHRPESLAPIAQMIATFCSGRIGNYLIYFPSYSYMKQVYELFISTYPQFDTLLQTGGMSESERENFLTSFHQTVSKTLIGFCVLGGIYAEGIDLKGDRLIGAVIVGVGLPQISLEQNLLRDYYQDKNGQGFQYAYQFPGMNKVLQAAGRVIRGENDRGIVLLIDSRFTTSEYRSLFPEHWNHAKIIRSTMELEHEISAFWDSPKSSD